MKIKEKNFDQYLVHDVAFEESLKKYLEKTAPLIGNIVVKFNTLEEVLNLSICSVFNSRSDMLGLMIIHNLSYAQKVDLFDRFTQQYFLPTQSSSVKIQEKRNKLVAALRECGVLRNAVVHANWESTDYRRYTFVKLKINSKGLIQEYRQLNLVTLKRIKSLIEKTIKSMDRFELK
jgi:hypothetical protein